MTAGGGLLPMTFGTGVLQIGACATRRMRHPLLEDAGQPISQRRAKISRLEPKSMTPAITIIVTVKAPPTALPPSISCTHGTQCRDRHCILICAAAIAQQPLQKPFLERAAPLQLRPLLYGAHRDDVLPQLSQRRPKKVVVNGRRACLVWTKLC